jgi:hypothetical protein
MAKKPLTMEFSVNGYLLEHSWCAPHLHSTSVFEEAKDFDDRIRYLKFRDYSHGCSRALFESMTTGRQYTMFLDHFDQAITSLKFVDNHIEGTFRFVKKGTAQAIKLVLENKS